MYRVWYYRTPRGDRPVELYLKAQQARHRAKIRMWLELLARQGPDLRRPFADVVEGRIRELRIGLGGLSHRILYYFVPGSNVVLLHAFPKKTPQVPRKELKTAKARALEFDRRLAQGEVLK